MKEYNNTLEADDYKKSLQDMQDKTMANACYDVCDTLQVAKEALIGFKVIQEYDKDSPLVIQIANAKLIVETVDLIMHRYTEMKRG